MSTLSRPSTAVYGGSNSLIGRDVSLLMYGIMYPIEQAGRASETARDRELYEYIRWEYQAADRSHIVVAARRAAAGGRGLHRKRFWSRVRGWLQTSERAGEGTIALSATNE